MGQIICEWWISLPCDLETDVIRYALIVNRFQERKLSWNICKKCGYFKKCYSKFSQVLDCVSTRRNFDRKCKFTILSKYKNSFTLYIVRLDQRSVTVGFIKCNLFWACWQIETCIYPEKEISLDDGLITWKGHLRFYVCMPDRPHTYMVWKPFCIVS